MEDQKKSPSLFLGVLARCAGATAIGSLVVIWLSVQSGQATAEGGYKVLVAVSAMGALLGYDITVKRRKARGVTGPYDTWSKFFGSWMFYIIGSIILVGSFGIAALIAIMFDAIAGPPP